MRRIEMGVVGLEAHRGISRSRKAVAGVFGSAVTTCGNANIADIGSTGPTCGDFEMITDCLLHGLLASGNGCLLSEAC